MRSLESELVGKEETNLIAKLNSEGKRVVRIDHQKRAGGFGEWSATHATITALWEAGTEDPNYKSYINRQRAHEEQLRKQDQEKARQKQENYSVEGYCVLYKKDGGQYTQDFEMLLNTDTRKAHVEIKHMGGTDVS